MALEEWLRAAGLAPHAETFARHTITLDQLATLTETDLRELGLTIGERKRFLRAVAAQPPPGAAELHPPPLRGERRPLTVMFVDLVNSTALGERLDPEDLLEVTRRYRMFCGNAIGRTGGTIARFVGDGILAYFSYPIATENDPERAVRSALEIVRGIGDLDTPAGERLRVRIGIATGRVVVSDLAAGGIEDRAGVVGSVPNLAARLQSLAPADGIVIGETTHGRIAGRFACTPLGLTELRGLTGPYRPWRVIGERAHEAGAATGSRRLTTLVNRVEELAALRADWQGVVSGEARSVLIVGEAGIGKSRLVEEMLEHHMPRAGVVRLAASAFDQDSPLRPFVDDLRLRAGLTIGDSVGIATDKLRAVLRGDRERASPLLARLIAIDAAGTGPPPPAPEQFRERSVAALVEQLLALAEAGPICMVVEDLHWLDPTSLELLDLLVPGIVGRPILLLLTARDGFAADWTGSDRVRVLRLSRLGADEVETMIHFLLGDRPTTPELVERVVAKTDGVPLFVEEVARGLLECPLADADVPAPEGYSDAELAIPESLLESLIARLDRVGEAKEVAQIAAVIGRSAHRSVLALASDLAQPRLDAALDALVATGVLERGLGEHRDRFTFNHVLVRDAAYASLLRERRRTLHLRVARAIEACDPNGTARDPSVLAHHLLEAGRASEAAPLLMEAARRSLATSASAEATRLLRRGLDALERLPPEAEALRLRLQVSALLGPALIGLRGVAAPETRALYTEAYALAQRLPEEPAQFPIYWGWWRLSSDGRGKVVRAGALLRRARAHKDPGLLLQAHHCCWASRLHGGAFEHCRAHVAAGLALYERGDFTHHARLYGNHDARVCALGVIVQVHWMQGRLRAGLQAERDSLEWSERLDHLGSRVNALGLALLHRAYRRDHPAVLRLADELISLTAAHGLADQSAAGLIFRGWVIGTQHDPLAGLAMVEDGITRQREMAASEDYPVYLCLLAEVLSRVGRAAEAVERIERDRPKFDRIGLRIWIPELIRVLAETKLAAEPNAIERAAALLAEARALAKAQAVPMLGLRIALSAARVDLRQGELARAADALTTALSALPAETAQNAPDADPDVAAGHRLLARIGDTAGV